MKYNLSHLLFLAIQFIFSNSVAIPSTLNISNVSLDRGIVICSSANHLEDSIDLIEILRHTWKTDIAIAIAHCSEIEDSKQELFKEFGNIIFLNICAQLFKSFSSYHAQESRLRGYFCKPAALIRSPFKDTMIIDTDTIWLKKPDLLFDSPGYRKDGALFFRDRFICDESYRKQFVTDAKNIIERNSDIRFTSSFIKNETENHGISYFWFHLNDSSKPPLKHVQESSVVIINKLNHAITLEVIERLLPSFSLGYGEKEIYWISSTIAKESFSWEPFLFGTYGDCGAVLHYDPRQINELDPNPFFINAEYLLECAVDEEQDMEIEMTLPLKATVFVEIFNLGSRYDPRTGAVCGLCRALGCAKVPDGMNNLIAATRRLRIKNNRKPLARCSKQSHNPKPSHLRYKARPNALVKKES